MRTATLTRVDTRLFLFVIAAISIAMVASTITERSHAVAKHGSSVTEFARNCSDNGQVFQVWKSNERRAFIELCMVDTSDMLDPEKSWVMRVIDSVTGEEITAFTHTGDYWSVQEYLIRQLYILIGG